MQEGWTTVRDDNEDVFDLSAYGMTRSGAAHGYICLQRHQDGMILFSGMDLSLCPDISFSQNSCTINKTVKSTTKSFF